MSFRPLGNRVLVRREEVAERTPGGLLLPETSQRKANKGEVLAVGEGDEIEVTVGNTILFAPHAGVEIGSLFIIEAKDILGVF